MWNEFTRSLRLLVTRVALRGEKGQGLVEYALILALVSVATIAILGVLGGDIGSEFSQVTSAL